jgi:hypothetical protein
MMTTPKTKPISFADFLEQTERKNVTDAETASHTISASDTVVVSDAKTTPHVDSASGAKTLSEPVRKVRDANIAPHAESAPVKGHLRLPNEVLYRILPTLKPSEAIVLLRLYALSHGFHKDRCTVSLDTLANGCNLSRTQTRVCVRSLEVKRLIKNVGIDNTNSIKDLRGITIQVLLPTIPRAESARDAKIARDAELTPNKETHIKEHTQTQSGVRASSRFDLQECRRYAEHLRSSGQGITNPGGYATKIHRSGEADELVAAFLAPNESAPSVDVSKCLDCRGTGFWEPGGVGKGVAKCKHERLL